MASWRENKLWKEQKRFIITTAIIGFFLPIIILFLKIIVVFSFTRYFVIPTLFLGYVMIKSIERGDSFLDTLRDYCTFVTFDYVERESLLEKRFNATYALILINVAIHYGLELLGPQARSEAVLNLAFLPLRLHPWNLLLGPLTNIFLHADAEHLWGNMFFLWVFGLVLERRIGWKRLLAIYLISGVVGSLISAYLDIALFASWSTGIGASGAISGLIGAFALRLFYKRMVFPLPILGVVSGLMGFSLKVRMNSLMLIMFYFFHDFMGGLMQLAGVDIGIGFLDHLGGTFFGMYLASRMKFQDAAVEEMMLERAETAIDESGDNQQAERLLELLLEKNPDRVEALVLLARLKNRSRPSEEGKWLYLKAMDLLIEKEPEKAAQVFAEYFGCYREPLEPDRQYRLTGALEKIGKASLAARALELLVDDPETPEIWRPRLLYRAAQILEKLEFFEGACFRYEQLLEKYPDFPEVDKVRQKLEKLKTVHGDTTWSSFVRKKSDTMPVP
ncbi:MAG: Rhomboid family protein [Candidatus Saccharicenans subterraneus]|uniref:Rhomboid family protein n=1 Tax=Candidatus Saccharicenans subterraneus TaxID=2508984 RepID=A0A3E2BJP9_9BACT|nr:MAG: Rhomboid family protein [Candidatus Saccharicenans subterraneum]